MPRRKKTFDLEPTAPSVDRPTNTTNAMNGRFHKGARCRGEKKNFRLGAGGKPSTAKLLPPRLSSRYAVFSLSLSLSCLVLSLICLVFVFAFVIVSFCLCPRPCLSPGLSLSSQSCLRLSRCLVFSLALSLSLFCLRIAAGNTPLTYSRQ